MVQAQRNFQWVDQGLSKLGLAVDLDQTALPTALQGQAVTIDALMDVSLALAEVSPQWQAPPSAVTDPARHWTVEVGKLPGNPYFVSRTVVPNPTSLDLPAFLAFAVDSCMTEVALSWDVTFRSAAFSHVILRSGEVFAAGERSLAGIPWQDVAKVMRWVFAVPGLKPRELLSVYVGHGDAGSATWCYFPVRGDQFGTATGCVRARLTVPCLDRITWADDHTTSLLHYASAQLGGAMPKWFTTSAMYGRAFLKAAVAEADHLTAIADGTGTPGTALVAAIRTDGTV
jgi:hypothetical protein